MMGKKNAAGFTIVELTIASAVFALVLVVALTSFLGIGKVYYKSISVTQTQAVAQQIISEITSDVQQSATIGAPQSTGSGGLYMCLGSIRYTYNLYNMVNLDDHDFSTKFGLVRDTLPGDHSCASPFVDSSNPSAKSIPFSNPQELLGSKMRLGTFTLGPSTDAGGATIKDLWKLSLKIAYGDDQSLQNPDNGNVSCDSGLNTSEFCSVSNQTVTISRGF